MPFGASRPSVVAKPLLRRSGKLLRAKAADRHKLRSDCDEVAKRAERAAHRLLDCCELRASRQIYGFDRRFELEGTEKTERRRAQSAT